MCLDSEETFERVSYFILRDRKTQGTQGSYDKLFKATNFLMDRI